MTETCDQLDGDRQREAARFLPHSPWQPPIDDLLDELGVDPTAGLSPEEARRRRGRFGPNCIRSPATASPWQIFVAQFRSLIMGLLALAAIVAFAVHDVVEGIAILAVLVINAAIGFITEMRAIRSMEALELLGHVTARVMRGGAVREVDARELVPGDVVIVDAGDVVTADMRVIESSKLQADESALTGESVPVAKSTEPVGEDAPPASRSCMLYRGTAVTRGSGQALVVATGMNTELGLISSLAERAEEVATPLERRLDQLGRRLIVVTVIVAALVTLTGLLADRGFLLMLETGIALAVATIPEGLPIVTTLALARGMLRMAHRNALINRLSAVETLGAASVIAVDKTGTLTENRMTVRTIELAAETVEVTGGPLSAEGALRVDGHDVRPEDLPALAETLRVGVLCNNASLVPGDDGEYEATGDPMEVALLVAGAKAGMHRAQVAEGWPEVREEAFDPELNMMATVHRHGERFCVAVKGAPEAVLRAADTILTSDGERPLSESERRRWMEHNERLARDGLRVLAVARKEMDDRDGAVYEGITFLGLIGMIDPPREGVGNTVQRCQDAGIRFVMMTGDHPLTALAIARDVGLVDEEDEGQELLIEGRELGAPSELSQEQRERARRAQILARVTPEQKLDLIALHQQAGEVVAMTGDGVNDAPALKKADIGIAMGMRGTEVARQASDMILQDDRLETLVAAVEQGRIIFGNIRKFVLYLLSCNISEVLVVALASLADAPLPILPLQILFLNLVTDVFPALALGVGPGDRHVMDHPPRASDEPVMARRHWIDLGAYGAMITVAVLLSLWLALSRLGLEPGQATTVSFLTLATAQLWHVFNMRARDSGLLRNDISRNPWVWGALGLCAGLLVAALKVPLLARALHVSDPGPPGLLLALCMSLLPLVAGQIYMAVTNRTRSRNEQ